MGKLKDGIQDMNSCYSCVYSRDIVSVMSYKEKVYCLKFNRKKMFRKSCGHYEAMSCKNCSKLIQIKKEGLVAEIKTNGYYYYLTWLVKCTEYDAMRLKTKSDCRKIRVEYPSCSLWKRREK